jgi:hypothetical protein
MLLLRKKVAILSSLIEAYNVHAFRYYYLIKANFKKKLVKHPFRVSLKNSGVALRHP